MYKLKLGHSPLVGIAIHGGHSLREEVAQLTNLDDFARAYEEDTFTHEWAKIAPTSITVQRSRFEVDLNRPREKAVYLGPEDAWGLQVWRQLPERAFIDRSLRLYDEFYSMLSKQLTSIEKEFGHFVIYDLHSYNFQRNGPGAAPEPQIANPQINLGTGTMLNRSLWSGVIRRFMSVLQDFEFPTGRLDVRENIKFSGGEFPRWVHKTFPHVGCVLSIEVKKFYMDEWTGEVNKFLANSLGDAIGATIPEVLEELEKI